VRAREGLKEKRQFNGGYTIVKDYVRLATLCGQEMFLPLTHAPSEAQADFGEAVVRDRWRWAVGALYGLGTSAFGRLVCRGVRAETAEAFLEGMSGPSDISEQGRGPSRVCTTQLHDSDSALTVGRSLNAHLEAQCCRRRERRLRGHTEIIDERFERDRARMLPLPATPYEACEKKITVRVTSLSLVRYRGNDYSVPTEFGHRQVLVKGFVHEVVIACVLDCWAYRVRSSQSSW